MARGVKVKMNAAACIALMNSSEVQQDLLTRAERIKAAADAMGSGTYEADVQPGRTRAHARVKTPAGDFRTMASNRKHNSLLKALGEWGGYR